jgi:copper homeostasis protein
MSASLEIICLSLSDALNAQAGGADSLELCEDLSVGGLTPPIERVKAIRDAVKTCRLYMMLRPHARSFVYDPRDQDHIWAHLRYAQTIGVDGIVVGALQPDNTLDMNLMTALSNAKGALDLTMHRALDHTPNPNLALASIAPIAQRVLCSGDVNDVWTGRETMQRWVQAHPQVSFVCAGGVTLANIAHLRHITRAQEYHCGSAARSEMGVDAQKVAQLKTALQTPRITQ